MTFLAFQKLVNILDPQPIPWFLKANQQISIARRNVWWVFIQPSLYAISTSSPVTVFQAWIAFMRTHHMISYVTLFRDQPFMQLRLSNIVESFNIDQTSASYQVV